MPVKFTAREIAEKYNRAARWYDWIEGILDVLGLRVLRRRLLRQASGQVLEVAAGTGKNLASYPRKSRVIATDLSIEMVRIARKKSTPSSLRVFWVVADTEALPFADRGFEAVVSSLSTCTFPNPSAAVGEMGRVCKTGGKVLLLEHGRSRCGRIGAWQDRHADRFAKPLGCHWNREPLDIVKTAGLRVVRAQSTFFGIFHLIEAMPAR